MSRYGARARLGEYVKMSTQNPTGWRPWNSRLSFYLENSFPLPTTGRGPYLVQPGVCDCAQPAVSGGLHGVGFPNYPGIGARGTWITHGGYPAPVYRPPSPVQLSGLGRVSATHTARRASTGVTVSSSTAGNAAAATNNNWYGRTQRSAGGSSGSNPWSTAGSSTNRRNRRSRTSTPGTGGADTSPAAVITGYDSDGNPIYAGTPSGQSIVGYDTDGNAIYSGDASAASVPSTTAAATTTGASWFSEDSLGLGLNNGIYAIGAVALILIMRKK